MHPATLRQPRKIGAALAGLAAVGVVALVGCADRSASSSPEPLPAVVHPGDAPATSLGADHGEGVPASPEPDRTGAGSGSSVGPTPRLAEVFPGVRVDVASKVVEFDGVAAVQAHDPETPRVYLEVICCTPDTREHEALVMTRAKPSNIHAGLLMIGLEPGRPGLVDFRGREVRGLPPEGAGVVIEITWKDETGAARIAPVEAWVRRVEDARPLTALPEGPGVWGPRGGWAFAGSRFVTRRDRESGEEHEVYDADGAGVVIGLTTFGSEVVAWRQVLSPESSITVPAWIVNAEAYPAMGTPVTVRIRPE